jgi:Protein kinase domain
VIDTGGRLAGYRVDEIVGRGPTATVYAATARARRVAIKVLAPELQENAAVRARYREAALRQQSLDHPSVLGVDDVVESGGELLIVTPLVERTLANLIADGSLTRGRALRILEQVADALDFAHRAGVVHGAVKPSNVLVGGGDDTYLADFGLASAVSQGSAAAASAGTIDYSAPERIRGGPPAPAADVYALACVLFESFTGEVPYPHESPAAALGAHIFDEPPLASTVAPGLPDELDAVLARGLAKDVADRPASARELVDAAAAALGPAGAAVTPPPREEPIAPPAEDRDDEVPLPPTPAALDTGASSRDLGSWRVWVAGALVVALAAVIGAWLGQRGPDEDVPAAVETGSRLAHEHDSAMRVLDVARTSGLESMRKASTRRTQARAATSVAVAYRTTSASVSRTEPPAAARDATDALIRGLDRAGVGYTRLARAARRGDERRFTAARRMILDAEGAIHSARERLQAVGY